MPQLVALFNGVGGAAAALVAGLELPARRCRRPACIRLTRRGGEPVRALRPPARTRRRRGRFTVLVGAVSFSGSLRDVRQAAGADDHPAGDLPRRPVPLRRQPRRRRRARRGRRGRRPRRLDLAAGCWRCSPLVSLLVGVLFVLPVGGADVPIVISLLNAFTGLTVAASGYVLDNVLLLVAGTLVGASGTILTRLMAAAMGRSLAATLFGAFRAADRGHGRHGRGPAGALRLGRGRRDPARLRPQGRHRPGLRAGGGAGPAHPPRAGRAARGARRSRCSTASTPSPAGCRGT